MRPPTRARMPRGWRKAIARVDKGRRRSELATDAIRNGATGKDVFNEAANVVSSLRALLKKNGTRFDVAGLCRFDQTVAA